MGGLGANIGSDQWNSAQAKRMRIKYFSAKVSLNLKPVRANPILEPEKKITSREIGLLYAKGVPKPKNI